MIGHDFFPMRGRALRAATACMTLLSLSLAPHAADACPDAVDFAAFPSALRTIQPEALFPAGTPTSCPGGTNASPCGGHRVYVPDPNHPEPRSDQLYLFLPGTQGEPDKYDHVLSMAAFAGYKTIGLSYDNTTRLETACGNTCACYGPARREVVFGGNLSPVVAVQTGDTIYHRLYLLLDELDVSFPMEGWRDFLDNDDNDGIPEFTDIDWDEIVISGHSQGAGHGMVITKAETVDGILLLDGGNDDCSGGGRTYAQWHDMPNTVAPRRSFNHARGGAFAVPGAFIAMDFGASSTDLDAAWPAGSDVATTDQTPVAGCTEHGSMAYDGCMPDALGGAPSTPADAYLFPFYLEWMCEVGN